MADLSTLANARLLVRPDLTAIRLDQALDRGARPARRPAGPAPELRSGEKLSAGVAYPNQIGRAHV